jgi:hypothetical protein
MGCHQADAAEQAPDCYRSDAHIVENGYATSGSVSKSAKVVLMSATSDLWGRGNGIPNVLRDHSNGIYQIIRIIAFSMGRYRGIQRGEK